VLLLLLLLLLLLHHDLPISWKLQHLDVLLPTMLLLLMFPGGFGALSSCSSGTTTFC
jgi:hypothetical protein